MSLITRTIPALLLGLSGLTLGTASLADSSFRVTISSGYPVSGATYAYNDSYRPRARACNPYRRPPAHIDTYIEKRVYKDYGHHKRHSKNDERHGYYGRRHEQKKYRSHDEHRSRKHGDKHERRQHTGYARTGYF